MLPEKDSSKTLNVSPRSDSRIAEGSRSVELVSRLADLSDGYEPTFDEAFRSPKLSLYRADLNSETKLYDYIQAQIIDLALFFNVRNTVNDRMVGEIAETMIEFYADFFSPELLRIFFKSCKARCVVIGKVRTWYDSLYNKFDGETIFQAVRVFMDTVRQHRAKSDEEVDRFYESLDSAMPEMSDTKLQAIYFRAVNARLMHIAHKIHLYCAYKRPHLVTFYGQSEQSEQAEA